MIQIINSKKADVSVTLIVLLTISLCVVSLVFFWFSEHSSDAKISNINVINNFYAEQEIFEFNFKNIMQASVKQAVLGITIKDYDKDILKESVINNFTQNYMVKQVNMPEYLDQEYKNQIRNKSKYDVFIAADFSHIDFKFNNLNFSKKPGVEKDQDIGEIIYVFSPNVRVNV